MKLREWKDQLDRIVSENPSLLDLDVVCASDDEGNNVDRVWFGPVPCEYSSEDFCIDTGVNANINAVCLN